MSEVGQDQLQGVLAGLQLDHGLGLTATEVLKFVARCQGLIHWWQLVHVDEQVMVTGVRG